MEGCGAAGKAHGVLAADICCDLILDGESVRGTFGGIVQAGQREDRLEEVLVALLERGILALEIIVAVTHAEAALAHIENLVLAVGQVGFDTDAVETAFPVKGHLAELGGEGFLAVNGLDGGDIGKHRLGAGGVAGRGVETHLIKVGNLLVDGAEFGIHLGHVGEKGVEILAGRLGDHVEGTETGEFGLQGVGFHPAAGGVGIEVNLGADGRVQIALVDTFPRGILLVGAAGGRHHSGHHHHEIKGLFHI